MKYSVYLTQAERKIYKLKRYESLRPEISDPDVVITTEQARAVSRIIKDLPKEHKNYLRWAFARMYSPPLPEYAKIFYKTCKAARNLKDITSITKMTIQITAQHNEKTITEFLPITNNRLLSVGGQIWQILKPYIEETAVMAGNNEGDKLRRGRPKGSKKAEIDLSFSNLADNLIKVIGCSPNRAKQVVFKYGVLLNCWSEKCPKGKYRNSQQGYEGKMINKYFSEPK